MPICGQKNNNTMKYLNLLFLGLYVTFASSAQNITIVRDAKAPRAQYGAKNYQKPQPQKDSK